MNHDDKSLIVEMKKGYSWSWMKNILHTHVQASRLGAKGLLLHLHQLSHEANVGAHARALGQDVLIGLVQGPVEVHNQVRDRRCHGSRFASLAVDIDRRLCR